MCLAAVPADKSLEPKGGTLGCLGESCGCQDPGPSQDPAVTLTHLTFARHLPPPRPPKPQFMCHYYKVSLPMQPGSVTQVKHRQKTTLRANKADKWLDLPYGSLSGYLGQGGQGLE